jgi:hypothetical protein
MQKCSKEFLNRLCQPKYIKILPLLFFALFVCDLHDKRVLSQLKVNNTKRPNTTNLLKFHIIFLIILMEERNQ